MVCANYEKTNYLETLRIFVFFMCVCVDLHNDTKVYCSVVEVFMFNI